uniref:Uncharacterized protein LOC116941540 n=1 Tax=Petromyzon marinus TaxID=7757 RepID=A0AAJ7WTY6_PETMA|nr:uncharacterized protein LOC116941540 [Petromyzon marinus]
MARTRTLLEAEARSAVRLEPALGVSVLRTGLGWTERQCETEPWRALALDCVLDTLVHCSTRGLPWACLPLVASLTLALLHDTTQLSQEEVLRSLKERVHGCLGSGRPARVVLHFFSSTYVPHFRLWRAALLRGTFTASVASRPPPLNLEVEVPLPMPPLQHGMEEGAAERRRREAERLEEAEVRVRTDARVRQEELRGEGRDQLEKVLAGLSVQEGETVDAETLALVLREAISVQILTACEVALSEIRATFLLMEARLDTLASSPTPGSSLPGELNGRTAPTHGGGGGGSRKRKPPK